MLDKILSKADGDSLLIFPVDREDLYDTISITTSKECA